MSGKKRLYSKVSRRLWNDAGFASLSQAQPNAQTLWLRLLTGPELTNIPGVIEAGAAQLAEALGWPVEQLRERFAELSERGMAKADWEARLIWIPRAIEHNPPANPNVVASWEERWDLLPECALKDEAYRALARHCERRGKGFVDRLRNGCGDGLPNRMPNQEQEQEQETTTTRQRTEPQAEWAKVVTAFEDLWHKHTGNWLGLSGGSNNQRRAMAVAADAVGRHGDGWLDAVRDSASHAIPELHSGNPRSPFAVWCSQWAKWCQGDGNPVDVLRKAIDQAEQRGDFAEAERLEQELHSLAGAA